MGGTDYCASSPGEVGGTVVLVEVLQFWERSCSRVGVTVVGWEVL